MKPLNEGILSAIGDTPLVRLNHVPGISFRLYAKLEALNPGGSIKDRTAVSIIKHAFETGKIGPDTVVIESSSGNMGIGLAQACAFYGLRFICVVDPKTTAANINILRAYRAEIDLVSTPDPKTGEFLQARIERVQSLCDTVPNSFWPDQYSNPYNPHAHRQTANEIIEALNGDVDFIFCATSTCGTMRGCAEYLRSRGLKTKIIAVDAVGSVIFGGEKAKRLIPGHGAAIVPPLFREELADDLVQVTDLDCVVGCHRLVMQEGILAGGSSGGVFSAVEHYRPYIPKDATCVLIFPDRGERYLDTIFSDSWVEEHFGAVAHLWEKREEICEMVTY